MMSGLLTLERKDCDRGRVQMELNRINHSRNTL